MNAKKIKALRKMMKNLEKHHQLPERQYLENSSQAPSVIVSKEELEVAGLDPEKYASVETSPQAPWSSVPQSKQTVYKVKSATGPIQNDPKSVRGVYRHFKNKMSAL